MRLRLAASRNSRSDLFSAARAAAIRARLAALTCSSARRTLLFFACEGSLSEEAVLPLARDLDTLSLAILV